MRVGEALMLGSTLLKPLAGQFDDGEGSGCALGMIHKAVGGTRANYLPGLGLWAIFPWIAQRPAKLPCDCKGAKVMGSGCDMVSREHTEQTVSNVIVHLFNQHVCNNQDWSIERLADWIEQLDPTPHEVPADACQSSVETVAR